MKLSTLSALKLSSAALVMVTALAAVPVLAQDAPTSGAATAPAGDVIIVTGSRIARPDLQGSSPVAVVSAQTLKQSNTVTIESYLSQAPQFTPEFTSASNNPGDGTASVDLRGIGSIRTLVLVDGKRMVPANVGGVVDINSIPTALLKRVDILTGGASSVYGADAISGVVNFILDDKFEGFSADASNQISSRGDGRESNISVAAGLKLGSRGHFAIAGQYTDRDGLYQDARNYSRQNTDSTALNPNGPGLLPKGSTNTTPTAVDFNGPTPDPITLKFPSLEYQLNNGTQPGGVNDLVPFYNYYNFNPANYLQIPLRRYSATALFNYDLTDSISFYSRGSYTNSKVTQILAPTATAGFAFNIQGNNPFLTPQQQALLLTPQNAAVDSNGIPIANTYTVGIRRRVTETGGRIEKLNSHTYFIDGGFKGNIGSKYHWEVFAQYGETKQHQDLLNDLEYNNIQAAVNAIPGPNGPVCAAPSPDSSATCVPINLFTTAAISPDALKYVSANGSVDNKFTQFVTGANLGGDLDFLKSPLAAKPAAVSVGIEYRKETGNQAVDANYASGNLIYYGQGSAVPNVSTGVKEIFGEAKIPLITGVPLIEALNIEGGIRYSSYTNNTNSSRNNGGAGGAEKYKYKETTYKFGGDWTPVNGLRLRALFNRAIRDPSLNELNAPVVSGSDTLNVDPCARSAPTGNAALTAVCIAQGAPASAVGTINTPVSGQINNLTGGNPTLTPEKSNTLTAGIVITPPQIHNFSLTVDYYNIKITDFITTFGGSAQNISDQCFKNNDPLYCKAFIRNKLTGTLSGGTQYGIVESLANVGVLKTRGIDISSNYTYKFGQDDHVDLSFAGTYVDKYSLNPGAGISSIVCAGKFGFSCGGVANGNPIPRWKHVASIDYTHGPADLFVKWRHIGPVSEDAGTAIIVSRIKAYNYIDATLTFHVTKEFQFRLGVDNIFDIQPPNVGGNAGGANGANTFPSEYDTLGATIFAGASIKF